MIFLTEKIFWENPYLKELDGRVVKNEYKDNSSYIELNRTIFYPHLAGGQPMDFGSINGKKILEVYQEEDRIIHVIKGEFKGNRAHMSIDWNRRWDLMQQHTGQHLLSSSFYRLFNAETIGIHIGEEYSTIDLKKPFLTDDEASQAEFLANKMVQSNFRVKSYLVDRAQLANLPLRRNASVEDDMVRIVEIDNIDYSPCCGTHVSNTGEIGIIKIRRWEKYKGKIRVEFLCGNRALRDYYWKNKYIYEIGKLLSSKDVEVLNSVNHLYASKEILERENRSLREELLDIKSQLLLKESFVEDDISYIIKKIHDGNIKDINYLASKLNKSNKLIQIYSIANDEIGQFLISRSDDLDLDLKEVFERVSNQIIIKGGGHKQMIQGASSLPILDNVIKIFIKEIKEKLGGN